MRRSLIFATLCLLEMLPTSADETDYTAAKCDLGKYGVIYFREKDGYVEAYVHLHNLPESSARYYIHAHTKPHKVRMQSDIPAACEGIGHGLRDADGSYIGVIEGEILSDATGLIHQGPYPLPGLLLESNDATKIDIIGRSMAVHTSAGKKIGPYVNCCDIQEASYDPKNFPDA